VATAFEILLLASVIPQPAQGSDFRAYRHNKGNIECRTRKISPPPIVQGLQKTIRYKIQTEAIMFKVYLTTDPQTRRGLYDSEAKFMGIFRSMQEADEVLGELLSFCSIRSVI
jgi:hypothetical protein